MTDTTRIYDAIILGAGINGCGIAGELTNRGQHVVVIDKGMIGGGTSSKSSRLIHGGLRYLEHLHLRLVHEALHDRTELVDRYPDLVTLQPFYLPVYDDSPRSMWTIWAGLKMYDVLTGSRSRARSNRVPLAQFCEKFPALRRDRLQAVFRYYDGKTHDWDLTRRVAQDARQQGCEFLEKTSVNGIDWDTQMFRIDTDSSSGNGAVAQATTLQTRCLINATGPWIDEVITRFHLPATYAIRKVSGIHIFFAGLLTPFPLFLQTGSKRIFFVIPDAENNQTMVGTTEREESVAADQVTVTDEDVQYLVDGLNAYLAQNRQVSLRDVQDVCIGIRPLVENRAEPSDLSREYRLDLHERGGTQLLHIFGGKLTTYPSLARKVADTLGVR